MKFLNQSINDWRALIDDRDLTIEEEGFFQRMTHLVCRREEHLLDDDAQNARMLRVDVRTYRRIKKRLLALTLVRVVDGSLLNDTAEAAIAAYQEHRRKACDGGRKSAAMRSSGLASAEAAAQLDRYLAPTVDAKSEPIPPLINHLGPATPKPSPKPNPKEVKRESEETLTLSKGSTIDLEVQAASATVVNLIAKPIPQGWQPNEAETAFANECGLCAEEVAAEAASFVSYHLSTDRNALQRNWSERWKQWIRQYDRSKSKVGKQAAWTSALNAVPPQCDSVKTLPVANRLSDDRFVRSSLAMWISFHDHWPASLGYSPADHRCAVPDEVLAEFGIRKPGDWSERPDYSLPLSERVAQEMGVAG